LLFEFRRSLFDSHVERGHEAIAGADGRRLKQKKDVVRPPSLALAERLKVE